MKSEISMFVVEVLTVGVKNANTSVEKCMQELDELNQDWRLNPNIPDGTSFGIDAGKALVLTVCRNCVECVENGNESKLGDLVSDLYDALRALDTLISITFPNKNSMNRVKGEAVLTQTFNICKNLMNLVAALKTFGEEKE